RNPGARRPPGGLVEACLEHCRGFQVNLIFGEGSLECANCREIRKSPVITGVGARRQNPQLRPFSSSAAALPFPDDKIPQILARQTRGLVDYGVASPPAPLVNAPNCCKSTFH